MRNANKIINMSSYQLTIFHIPHSLIKRLLILLSIIVEPLFNKRLIMLNLNKTCLFQIQLNALNTFPENTRSNLLDS